MSKPLEIAQRWKIYEQEGIINNAVNKIAAILSGGGHFKVRSAKLGRKPGPVDKLLAVLNTWQNKVNTSSPEGVVTGARGLQAITHQGVRRALVEGDWVARHVWDKFDVIGLGTFMLPMNVQSISAAELEPVIGLPPGAEAFYWRPVGNVIDQLIAPTDKNAIKIIKQFIPKDMAKELKEKRKYFLDPALMLHVRHRGVDTSIWGESFITPALQAIAYKRAIDELDFSTMQNLINRLTIVMVGSSDPNSPYSKADVASARQSLMASFFEDPGPNMTIIWSGDDVKVENVGADNVLSLDGRHDIAIAKIKMAVGVPEALLSGSNTDGKSAGWAAALGSAAQLEELQNAFAKVWTQLGERIAEENGFTDIDLVFEFDKSLLVDRVEEMNQTRLDYVAGLTTISDLLASRNKDPEAVFLRKCFERGLDPDVATWEEAFMAPQGMAGQAQSGGPQPMIGPDGQPVLGPDGQPLGTDGKPLQLGPDGKPLTQPPPGNTGPGAGRQPNNTTGKTTPDRAVRPTTKENK